MIYMDMNICIYGIYGENKKKKKRKVVWLKRFLIYIDKICIVNEYEV